MFAIFFKNFLNLFQFLLYFPSGLLQGLIKSCRLVTRTNGMEINVLIKPALAVFY